MSQSYQNKLASFSAQLAYFQPTIDNYEKLARLETIDEDAPVTLNKRQIRYRSKQNERRQQHERRRAAMHERVTVKVRCLFRSRALSFAKLTLPFLEQQPVNSISFQAQPRGDRRTQVVNTHSHFHTPIHPSRSTSSFAAPLPVPSDSAQLVSQPLPSFPQPPTQSASVYTSSNFAAPLRQQPSFNPNYLVESGCIQAPTRSFNVDSIPRQPPSSCLQPDDHPTQAFSYHPPSHASFSQPPQTPFYSDPTQQRYPHSLLWIDHVPRYFLDLSTLSRTF